MLLPKIRLPAEQQRLLRLFRELPAVEQESLLSYAEFLYQRKTPDGAADACGEPLELPRPASETVVAAIKRLRSSFPMLDGGELLHETSSLMTAHVMQGMPAVEVIDELEVLFRRHYARIKPQAEHGAAEKPR